MGPPLSISNQSSPRKCYRPVWWSQFLHWESLFPNVLSWQPGLVNWLLQSALSDSITSLPRLGEYHRGGRKNGKTRGRGGGDVECWLRGQHGCHTNSQQLWMCPSTSCLERGRAQGPTAPWECLCCSWLVGEGDCFSLVWEPLSSEVPCSRKCSCSWNQLTESQKKVDLKIEGGEASWREEETGREKEDKRR